MAPAATSSAIFWALVDRWGVPDLSALRLIGRSGGLTARGTRPQFSLTADQARRVAVLLAIEDQLIDLHGTAGTWLRAENPNPPFGGAAPFALMVTRGDRGIAETQRAVQTLALRMSLAGTGAGPGQ